MNRGRYMAMNMLSAEALVLHLFQQKDSYCFAYQWPSKTVNVWKKYCSASLQDKSETNGGHTSESVRAI